MDRFTFWQNGVALGEFVHIGEWVFKAYDILLTHDNIQSILDNLKSLNGGK